MTRKPPLILIDASIYIFRYYFSLPERWWSDCGRPTAALLEAFESVSALLENTRRLGELPIRGAAGLGARLREHEQQLRLYRQLTTICTEAPLERRLQLKARRPDLATVAALDRKLGFGPGFDRLLDPLRVGEGRLTR